MTDYVTAIKVVALTSDGRVFETVTRVEVNANDLDIRETISTAGQRLFDDLVNRGYA